MTHRAATMNQHPAYTADVRMAPINGVVASLLTVPTTATHVVLPYQGYHIRRRRCSIVEGRQVIAAIPDALNNIAFRGWHFATGNINVIGRTDRLGEMLLIGMVLVRGTARDDQLRITTAHFVKLKQVKSRVRQLQLLPV